MSAQGPIAFLAPNNNIGLSTFAVTILVLLAIAAGADYAISFRPISAGAVAR